MAHEIRCELCGKVMRQVTRSHLRVTHDMTTAEYRALGYRTLSPERLAELRETKPAKGLVSRRYGPDHWHWKDGGLDMHGYRIVYRNGTRIVEHRLVAETMLGRPLRPDEVIHHRDGNRANNAPENIVIMPKRKHDGISSSERWHRSHR